MIVSVNGEERELQAGARVSTLVDSLGARADGRGVAVAVDGDVVPRSAWEATALRAGARIEVLIAVQGG